MSDNIVKSFEAAEDLSGKQYYAVEPSTGNKCCALAGDAERLLGILINKPESGEAAAVVVNGIVPAILGEAVEIGDFLVSDTIGKLVQAGAADEYIIGMLIDDSDTVSTDDVRDILITHSIAHAADTGM